MNDQQWLNYALAKMHEGQWFGFNSKDQNYSNLIIHDSSIAKPTEDEVNAKIQELKDVEKTALDKRASGKQKLKDLGLDDEEIQALMGA